MPLLVADSVSIPSAATDGLANAVTLVTSALGDVVDMIASNWYLGVGFGLTVLGLGIGFIYKIRKI